MGRAVASILVALCLPSDAAAALTLHEYVPGLADAPTQVVGGGSEGENPSAIRIGSEAIPEPDAPPEMRTYASTDPNGHNYEFTPDLVTHLDGQLHYEEEFTPSIVPFARSKVLDTVTMPGYRLVVGDKTLEEVPVEGTGASTPARDLFWVTLQVELGAAPVPIPSASADVRVLSYRASPEIALRFLRDGADNLYVQGTDRRLARNPALVRITMLTDASAAYFGAELPGDVRVADLPAFEMAASARASGLSVAQSIGVSPDETVREALARLVSHFRSFEEADEALIRTGDVYQDLALGRRGVCRHRSFAFMVTANALGLRTRYVENDAHAFVEVLLPDTGWMRIDLGGAAAGITIENAADRPRHEPRRPDDLPQPEAYRRSYSQLAAPGVQGAPRPVDRGGSGPADPGPGPSGPDGAIDPTAIPRDPGGGAPDPGLGAAPAAPALPPLLPTAVRIDGAAPRARRGMPIVVSGAVAGPEGALPGLLVEVSLSKDGRTRWLLLGRQVTGPDGRFAGEFLLPPDLEPRRYFLLAGTPGDGTYAPSQSVP